MKKKIFLWLLASGVIMCLLPWLTVTFVRADAGMMVSFLLFFLIDPFFFICLGVAAGRNIQRLWSLPVISAGIFLLGAWAFFEMGEPDFLLYAGSYLVLGLAAMLVSWFLEKRR